MELSPSRLCSDHPTGDRSTSDHNSGGRAVDCLSCGERREVRWSANYDDFDIDESDPEVDADDDDDDEQESTFANNGHQSTFENGANGNGPASPPPIATVMPPLTTTPGHHHVKQKKLRQLPSSRGTVLTIVGLALTGLILLLSGMLVLVLETHKTFIVAGSLILFLGIACLVISFYLQSKNINKLRQTFKNDLFMIFEHKRKNSSVCFGLIRRTAVTSANAS